MPWRFVVFPRMKLWIAVLFALVALASAQFELIENTVGVTVSLNANGDIRNDTVTDAVIGCQTKIHSIQNSVSDQVATSSGSFSRSHWEVTLTNEDDDADSESLFVSLRDAVTEVEQDIILVSSGCNIVGTSTGDVDDSETCTFSYYCDNYFSTYEVVIYQPGVPNTQAVSNYTLTVTQYVESVQVIGDLYDEDDSSVVRNENNNGPFPRRYRHYYHDLGRDLAERGLETEFEVTLFNVRDDLGGNYTSNEEVRICVQFNHIVAQDTSGTGLNVAGDCPTNLCSTDTLDGNTQSVTVDFTGCNLPDTMFIGVNTPNDDSFATYSISVNPVEKTIYPITVVTEQVYRTDGRLADDTDCDPSTGNFTCEAYYEQSFSTVGLSNSAFDGKTGPWLSVVLHGIIDTSAVSVHISDNDFGGALSSCSGPSWSCTADENEVCHLLVSPCTWSSTGDYESRRWVVTVESDDVDGDQLFYGLDIDIVDMEHTSVSLAPEMGPFITAVPYNRYQHYSVSIPDSVLETAQLIFELYAEHTREDVTVYWNYGDFAGSTSDCLSWNGRCNTDGDDSEYFGYGAHIEREHNFCRFQFIGCDDPFLTRNGTGSVTFTESRLYSDYGNDFDGLRVASLIPGVYYFSVRGSWCEDCDRHQYDTPYTMWMYYYEDVQELQFDRTVLGHIFQYEYSRQYVIDMPEQDDDFTIAGINLHVADVQAANSAISAYWNCDAPAGDCPCWENRQRVDFGRRDNEDHQATWFIPLCECPGRIYLAVEYRQGSYRIHPVRETLPAGFTVLATVVHNAVSSAELIDGTFTAEIDVPRWPQWSINSEFVRPDQGSSCTSCAQYVFYRFNFDQVSLTPDDTFVTRLEFTPEVEDDRVQAWLYVLSSSNDPAVDTCGTENFDVSTNLQACRARANWDQYESYWDGFYDGAAEEWSFCQIVFEACTAVVDDNDCYEEDNSFRGAIEENRHFDQTRTWYAAVQAVDDDDNHGGIHFTLYSAVRDHLTSLTLTNGVVALKDSHFENSYNHYSVVVDATTAANNLEWLTFEIYKNKDQHQAITFYLNKDSRAGREDDCFASNHESIARVCRACELGFDSDRFNDKGHYAGCLYQILPCDLEAGTYFLSAYQRNEGFLSHAFFDDTGDYTITVTLHSPTELLENNGYPITSHLSFSPFQRPNIGGPRNYYTVQVPSGTNNDISARLLITISSLDDYLATNDVPESSLYATIIETTGNPDDLCRCQLTGRQLLDDMDTFDTELSFVRDNCDLEGGETFYITIDGTHEWIYYQYSEGITFSLHAELVPIENTGLTLRNDDTSTLGLSELYNSEDLASSPQGPFDIVFNQYRSFSFSASNNGESALSVQVIHRRATNGGNEVDYWLTRDKARGRPSSNAAFDSTGAGSVGPLVLGSTCIDIDSCTFNGGSDEYCAIHLGPCQWTSGTYFITLGGEGLTVNTREPHFEFNIAVHDYIDVFDVSPLDESTPLVSAGILDTDAGVPFAIDSDDLDNFYAIRNGGHAYIRSVGSISLDAGEEVTFTVDVDSSNGCDFYVNLGSPAGAGCDYSCRDLGVGGSGTAECTIVACNSLNLPVYMAFIPNGGGFIEEIVDITISLVEEPIEQGDFELESRFPGASFNNDTNTYRGDVFVDDHDWVWFEFNVAAANDEGSRFFHVDAPGGNHRYWGIDTTAFPGFAGSRVVYPSLPSQDSGDTFDAVDSDGRRLVNSDGDASCGTIELADSLEWIADCCDRSAQTGLFAATHGNNVVDIEFFEYDYGFDEGNSASGTVGFVSDDADNRDTVNYHVFEMGSDTVALYYSFTVDENPSSSGVDLFLNYGSRAGSGTSGCGISSSMEDEGDFNCYNNVNTDLDNSCTGRLDNSSNCYGFLELPCAGCGSNNDIHFSVVSLDDVDVSYQFELVEVTVQTGGSFSYPSNGVPLEHVVDSSNDGLVYAYYQADFSFTIDDVPSWFPLMFDDTFIDDLDGGPTFSEDWDVDNSYYFLLELDISLDDFDPVNGFQNLSAAPDNLEIFIDYDGPFDTPCFGGSHDINSFCINGFNETSGDRKSCKLRPEDVLCVSQVLFAATIENNGFFASYTIDVDLQAVINDDFLADAGQRGDAISPSTTSTRELPGTSLNFETITSQQWSHSEGQTEKSWIFVDTANFVDDDFLRLYFRFNNDSVNVDAGRTGIESVTIELYPNVLPGGSARSSNLFGIHTPDPTDSAYEDIVVDVDGTGREYSNCDLIDNDDVRLNGVAECFIQLSPSQFSQYFAFDSGLWVLVDFGDLTIADYDNVTSYSFDIAAERLIIEPLDTTSSFVSGNLTTSSWTWNKEIFDFQWHFLEVSVDTNEGLFEDLTLSVTQDCNENDLYTYVSIDADIDVVRPGRFPGPATSVNEYVGDVSDVLATDCDIVAGEYLIAIYAEKDFQFFEDDNDHLAGSYLATVSLTERTAETLAPECSLSRSTSNGPINARIPVEAENRGSQLRVWVTIDDGEVSTGVISHALRVSHTNKYQHCGYGSSDTGVYTDVAFEYFCDIANGGDFCEIVVPECEFDQGYYYVWADVDTSEVTSLTTFTVYSEFDRKHIPVADLTVSTSQEWLGQLYGNFDRSFWGTQYYKVLVNSNDPLGVFSARLWVESCDAAECDLDFYVTRGAVGFSSQDFTVNDLATGNWEGDIAGTAIRGSTTGACHDTVIPGGNTAEGYLASSQGGIIWDPLCQAERGQYFIGVRQDEESHCVYSLEIQTQVSVLDLDDDVLVCGETACWDFYRYTIPDASESFTFEINNLDVTNDIRFEIGYGRVPFQLDDADQICHDHLADGVVTAQGSTSVPFNTGCQFTGDLYIGIYKDGFTTDCDVCENSIPYSIRLTASNLDYVAVDLADGEFLIENSVSLCSPVCGNFPEAIYGSSDRTVYVLSNETAVTVSPTTLSANQRVFETFSSADSSFGDVVRHYHYNSEGASSATFGIEILEVGDCENPSLEVSVSAAYPDFCGCGSSSDATVTIDDCAATIGDFVGSSRCDAGDWYITVWNSACSAPQCNIDFEVWIEATEVNNFVGGTHQAAFTELVFDNEDCSGTASASVWTQVTDILSISIKEPFGADSGSAGPTVTWSVDAAGGCNSVSCSASETQEGYDSSCRSEEADDDDGVDARYSCASAGMYRVDFTIDLVDDTDNYDAIGVQYQVVNQWVSLSSSVQDTIIGSTRHFYSVSTAGSALAVDLFVEQGPGIQLTVFDGCNLSNEFQHFQMCWFGHCLSDISTRALHSGEDVFYIVLTSADQDNVPVHVQNDDQEKETVYTLSVATGSGACASRPSTGFCGSEGTSVDRVFTSSAFTLSQNTWDYLDVQSRDDMARCRYESFVKDRCDVPDDECKIWLRQLACLDAFPACDEAGFLQGVCEAVCQQVEVACGAWLDEANQPRAEFGCLSGRYEAEQSGTCAVIPTTPIPEPPPVVVPVINPDDHQNVHIAFADSHVIGVIPGAINHRDVESVSCTATELQALIFAELSVGTLTLSEQIVVVALDADFNEASVQIFGSNLETATSLAVRLVNLVERNPREELDGTCLEAAVVDIEEPQTSLLIFSSESVVPTSEYSESSTNIVTVPGQPSVIPGVTIPSFSVSSAAAIVPSIVLVVLAVFGVML